ncbi:hypothetical protein GCM10022221_05990 [Actinocorallia aurea]
MAAPTGTDTRARALTVFAVHFAAAGYHGTSLDAVARDVGVKKPTLYHHFPGGKETLYRETALDFIAKRGSLLAEALATEGALAERLKAVILAFADPGGIATSFDQRVFDALDLVDADVRDEIRTTYVRTLLTPAEDFFAAAIAARSLAPADPPFLANAFLHLARAIDLTDAPTPTAEALVTLFLKGAQP